MTRKIPGTISQDEFNKILKATNQRNHKLSFVLGFWQCMRVSEVVKLRKEDVDIERDLYMLSRLKDQRIGIYLLWMRQSSILGIYQ